MSDLFILTQPKACQPAGGEFLHSAKYGWLVREVVDAKYYEDVLESDSVLEGLEMFGQNTWDVLEASGLFQTAALTDVKRQLISTDGTPYFYPVARLRPSDAVAISHPCISSLEEQKNTNLDLIQALSKNRFRLSSAARKHLGTGDLPGVTVVGRVNSLELLQMELSDHSVLLGWGWVWYRVGT